MAFTPQSQHYHVLKKLFPFPSMAGDLDPDLDVEGLALDRANGDSVGVSSLLNQILPDTADEKTIEDWERVYGVVPTSDALVDRRASVLAKMAATGGLSIEYFYTIAEALGYNRYPSATNPHIRIRDDLFHPFRACFSVAGDPVYLLSNGSEKHAWEVSGTDVSNDENLSLLFEALKPPYTYIIWVDN